MIAHIVQFCYLIATGLFVLALKWLSHPSTARRGVLAGVCGMTAAITGTLLFPEIVEYKWIVVALIVGTFIGILPAWARTSPRGRRTRPPSARARSPRSSARARSTA